MAETLAWRPSTLAEWSGSIPDDPASGNNAGGVDFYYTISGADLPQAVPIWLYWSDASTLEQSTILGAPITTGESGQPLMTNTAISDPDNPYDIDVPASQLGTPPPGTMYLLAVIDPQGILQDEVDESANETALGVSPDDVLTDSVHVFTQANDPADITNPSAIEAAFMPEGGALNVNQAAAICRVNHFNWVQEITLPPDWSWTQVDLGSQNITVSQVQSSQWPGMTVASPDITANQSGLIKASDGSIPNQTPLSNSSFYDPPVQNDIPDMYSFVGYFDSFGHFGAVSLESAVPVIPGDWQSPDAYDYYYNETAVIPLVSEVNYFSNNGNGILKFFDAPSIGNGRYLPGESTFFQTELAGVGDDTSSYQIYTGKDTNFDWTSNAVNVTVDSYWKITDPSILPPLLSGGVSGVQFIDPSTNLPPVLAPIADQTVNEGSVLTFTAKANDPEPGETLTYSLDPGAPAGASINPTTGVFTWTPGNGPQTVDVTVRVTNDGLPPLSNAQTFVINVLNVPPSVSLGNPSPVPVGATFGDTGFFTDPATQDSWTATVDYGDGSGPQPLVLNPDKTFALNHVYSNAGSYVVMVAVTDSGDAVGTATLTETVTQASTTTTVASSAASPIYGQSLTFTANVGVVARAGAPTGTVQFEMDGVDLGSPAQLVDGSATSDAIGSLSAGTHSITAVYSGDANFQTSTAANFTQTVVQAPLMVTADDENKVYGAPMPAFTASFSGFVLGQDSSMLGGTLTFTTPATATSQVGTDPIAPAGLTSPNYAITFVPGTLTITAAPLIINADNKSKVYGASLPVLTASYSGFVNGDTSAI